MTTPGIQPGLYRIDRPALWNSGRDQAIIFLRRGSTNDDSAPPTIAEFLASEEDLRNWNLFDAAVYGAHFSSLLRAAQVLGHCRAILCTPHLLGLARFKRVALIAHSASGLVVVIRRRNAGHNPEPEPVKAAGFWKIFGKVGGIGGLGLGVFLVIYGRFLQGTSTSTLESEQTSSRPHPPYPGRSDHPGGYAHPSYGRQRQLQFSGARIERRDGPTPRE